MHRLLLRITLPLLLTCLTWSLPALAADDQKPGQDLPPKFEPQITENLASGKFREALLAAAKYKEAVRACYPAATYTNGVLESEADHLRISCPFKGWKRKDADLAKNSDGPPPAGAVPFLALMDPKTNDTLAAISSDQTIINKMEDNPTPGETEKLLNIYGQIMGRLFGVPRYSSFATVGELRILSLELSGQTGNPIEMRLFSHGDQVYTFVLACAPSEKAEMKAKLLTMMKSIDFHYKPPQQERIAAIHAKVTAPTDVKQQLQAIRELVLCGEYGAAGADIDTIRLTLAGRIPKPVVIEDNIHYDTYGITITNPDPQVWKSVVQKSDGMDMMMLQNRAGVDTRGMLVAVLDPIILYGSRAEQMVGEKVPEAVNKTFLSNSARGGLMNINGKIEKEQFRTFKGMLTYEATATTNIPNVKVKLLVGLHSNYMVFMLVFVDPSDAEHQFKEYETILEKALTFK